MKPIKFNLLLDGKIVRSLDEMKDNFNIDDIYDLFNKRILQKWLRLQNEVSIAEELELITTVDPKIAIERILAAFGYDPGKMQTEIYAHLYGRTYREEVAVAISENKSHAEMIEDYHKNYLYLKEALHNFGLIKDQDTKGFRFDDEEKTFEYLEGVREIVSVLSKISDAKKSRGEFGNEQSSRLLPEQGKLSTNDHSYGAIKATIDEIGAHHLELLKLDISNFFDEFIDENPIVIMSCLMNVEIREMMLANERIRSLLRKSCDYHAMIHKLEPYLQFYEGDTEGMWKYLGSTDKKYLVLNITLGKSRVGEQSDLKKDFGHREVNGNYLVLSGLTFKSASATQAIHYLEV
ncbi:hypothetical protein [Exiguobacterium sp. R-17]|uniref:hypothetical protein n=1 Tax=Exiguobacterium sp. R-17 TaxID=3404054 RepID=UPI003CF76BF0